MCGISGILNKNGTTVAESRIREVNNLAAHRGPDDEGYYFHEAVAFGHRRLSIIDLSSAGHQPMEMDDRYAITYNGEIYNYLEIRQELVALGYSFASDSDTEVVLAAYVCWGEACAERFNGMWALAIHDRVEGCVFLSRDRFGKKPLYLIDTDEVFAFASEIKQLLPLLEERRVDFKIAAEFLIHGSIEHTNNTFFDKIKKLGAGCNLRYDIAAQKQAQHRYFTLESLDGVAAASDEELNTRYRDLFADALALRLRSDVTVGTCLSGGLDSSCVVANAVQQLGPEKSPGFLAITAKSTDPERDETHFAEEVVKHLGIDWKVVEPGYDDFLSLIDEVVLTQEEPFEGPSIVMQYCVMRAANASGCKVMLDGQGGDETLLGYENYLADVLTSYLKRGALWHYFKFLVQAKTFRIPKIRVAMASAINVFAATKIRIRYWRGNRRIKDKTQYLTSQDALVKSGWSDVFELQKNELFKAQLPVLLRYEDKNSMRNSVETRLPFLDYRLVQFACSVHPDYKIKNGYLKYLLRVSMEKLLPASIIWRKNKFGFEAPESSWFAAHRDAMMSAIDGSAILKEIDSDYAAMNGRELWRFYSFAKWEAMFNVSMAS